MIPYIRLRSPLSGAVITCSVMRIVNPRSFFSKSSSSLSTSSELIPRAAELGAVDDARELGAVDARATCLLGVERLLLLSEAIVKTVECLSIQYK